MQLTKILFSIFAVFLLAACQTGPVTQARIDAPASFWNDTYETTDARKCNKEFGLKLGTPAFGECMRNLSADRTQAFKALQPLRQQLIQQCQWQTYDGTPVNSAPATTSTGGFLKSQSTSGQMRYCSYNQMGSTVIVTIARHQICPLTN